MTMRKPRVLIPSGFGLNCERETAYTYEVVGADADIVHINDLIANPGMLENCQILDFIGGFSDGDHYGSGKVHKNRLKHALGDELDNFIKEGKLVIGVCNGFQAMAKYGMLPGFNGDYRTQRMTLVGNDSGKFEDRWVHLGVNPDSNCVWTKGIKELYLPVRHGEGKIRASDPTVLDRLERNNQVVLRYIDPRNGNPTMEYPYNPNGSDRAIAGVCDPTGLVFGKMPHREAYWSPYNNPNWTRLKIDGKLPKEGAGLQISRNGVEYAIANLI